MNREEVKRLRGELIAAAVHNVGKMLMFSKGIRVEDFHYHFLEDTEHPSDWTDLLEVFVHVPAVSSETVHANKENEDQPAVGELAAQCFKAVCLANIILQCRSNPDMNAPAPDMRVSYIVDGTGEFGIV